MELGHQAILALHLIALAGSSLPSISTEGLTEEETWHCSGWCFMGGDYPTNPWIPVSSTGATEDEARDNIDCGMYQEAGISCRKVQDK